MNRVKRRDFLKRIATASGAVMMSSSLSNSPIVAVASPKAMTVTGEIPASNLGSMLPHEHLMSLFGADITEKAVYDEPQLMEAVIPYLKKLRSLGCETIADCTAAYFGRAPLLLKQMSESSGVQVLTNTGYYAAANDRYVPEHAYNERPEQLAQRWINEWKNGIDETGIRPGFIKIGVDGGPLSKIDAKLVRAAALTHCETGLVIAAHTSDNPGAAKAQLRILGEEKVDPSAWIWVHANKVPDINDLVSAAEMGAWIELDGISEDSVEDHFAMLAELKKRSLEKRILLSHDGNSFRYGNRPPKAYHGLYSDFIPFLRKQGYSQDEIDQLTKRNPATAFAIEVRTI
jgi:phosphotriesterase-related protein